ncbi:hypothetical protein ANCCAN_09031 [Ancylostoma caninum]|uniref:Ig-like domain-containing protein n=1 Tax=Ancylostoma caninum TaxID=29170 RepID=A0A368GPZ9_ANCCA|nr:hypothetical protein ANCCAN_09031 [Ancylostoma caninum]
MSTPQEKEVNEGESVSFRCDAVGNPTPTVLWTRAGDDQIVAKGDTYCVLSFDELPLVTLETGNKANTYAQR